MKEQTIDQIVSGLQSSEESARAEAVKSAATAGPEAVLPLAKTMTNSTPEVARAATRALWGLIRAEGAPGSQHKAAVGKALLGLLGGDRPTVVRREALWMVSEICGSKPAVQPVAALLEDETLREDARQVLERLPGPASIAALKAGFVRADEGFKVHIAQSLHLRGAAVPGYTCRKLLPVKEKLTRST